MAQMTRLRQPGAAATAFMNTLVPAAARFSARARSARRPCRASATPRQPNTKAAASGIAASSAAAAGRRRAASASRYCAVKLTTAAAAASTTSPAAALRSHSPDLSVGDPGGLGWLPWPAWVASAGPAGRDTMTRAPGAEGWPVMSRLVAAAGSVVSGIGTVISDRFRRGIGTTGVAGMSWSAFTFFAVIGSASADGDAEQPADYRFGAGAGTAGEAPGVLTAADPGGENGQDADYRAGKESGDCGKRDGDCHCVMRLSCGCFSGRPGWLRPGLDGASLRDGFRGWRMPPGSLPSRCGKPCGDDGKRHQGSSQ